MLSYGNTQDRKDEKSVDMKRGKGWMTRILGVKNTSDG